MEIPPIIAAQGNKTMHSVPPRLTETPPKSCSSGTKKAAPYKWLLGGVISMVVCILLVVTVLYVAGTPKRSMRVLYSAMQRHDQQTVSQYIDAESLAASYRACGEELMKRESAKEKDDSIFAPLLDELGNQLLSSLLEETITRESIVPMLCGEEINTTLKKGLGKWTDRAVDAAIPVGEENGAVHKAVAKGLLHLGAGWMVNTALNNAAPDKSDFTKNQMSVQYESWDRCVIISKSPTSDQLSMIFVFKREGLLKWKWCEVRLLP